MSFPTEQITMNAITNVLQQIHTTAYLKPQFAVLSHYALLRLTGADAVDFLHKQVSNDVQHLPLDAACHATWCSAKGRMLASLLIFRQQDELGVVLARDLVTTTHKRLQMFVLRAQVSLIEQAAGFIGVSGPPDTFVPLLASLGLAKEAMSDNPLGVSHCTDNTLSFIRLTPKRGLLLVHDSHQQEKVTGLLTDQGMASADASSWLLQDIVEGLPLVCAATREGFVPQMLDFDRLGAINFTKGCYPGQEVVARTHYLGKVKRHLYRFLSPVPINPGAELFSPLCDGVSAGAVVSVQALADGRYLGLASILESAASDVHADAPDGPMLLAEAVFPDHNH